MKIYEQCRKCTWLRRKPVAKWAGARWRISSRPYCEWGFDVVKSRYAVWGCGQWLPKRKGGE